MKCIGALYVYIIVRIFIEIHIALTYILEDGQSYTVIEQ